MFVLWRSGKEGEIASTRFWELINRGTIGMWYREAGEPEMCVCT